MYICGTSYSLNHPQKMFYSSAKSPPNVITSKPCLQGGKPLKLLVPFLPEIQYCNVDYKGTQLHIPTYILAGNKVSYWLSNKITLLKGSRFYWLRYNTGFQGENSTRKLVFLLGGVAYYPACTYAARGKAIGFGVYIYIYVTKKFSNLGK